MNVRRQPADDIADLSLMGRIAKRPEQTNRNGLDALATDELPNGGLDVRQLERLQHRTLVIDPLANTGDACVRHQRRRTVGCDRMLDRLFGLAGPAAIGATRDEQRILEPGGRDEARARALAGENRVVDDGRTVQE